MLLPGPTPLRLSLLLGTLAPLHAALDRLPRDHQAPVLRRRRRDGRGSAGGLQPDGRHSAGADPADPRPRSAGMEGDHGTVEDITATHVTITTWDQRSLVVPLNCFMERPIRTWTKRAAQPLDTVFVYLDYTLPVGAIRAEAKRILGATPLWDRRVFTVPVIDLKERGTEIRVPMSAGNAGRMLDLRCLMREALIGWPAARHPNALPQEGVEMTGAGAPAPA